MSAGGLLARASARHFARHPWQLALAVAGVALGVALAVGIDVASASVRRAFALATEAASGRATHEIVGGPLGVPDDLYRTLRIDAGVTTIAPFVGGAAAVADRPGEVVQIVGTDPFADPELGPRAGWHAPGVRDSVGPLVARPGACIVTASTAARLALAAGRTLTVRIGAQRRTLTVVAVLAPSAERERALLDGVVLVDVATAQEAFDRVGHLDRIDVRADAATLERVRAALPVGVTLQPAATRTAALQAMTGAFELNLRALSLLALLVGAFLVYNAMTFAVVQRRALLGTLRTLGATRGELVAIVLREAAALGAAGAVLGCAVGVLLGRSLVGLVARAVTDLYFAVIVHETAVPAAALVRGAALGLGAAVLSALPAAREVTRVEPRVALQRSTLEARAAGRAPALAALGAALALAATAVLAVSGRSLALGLGALLLVVVGAALIAPAATALIARLIGPVLRAAGGLPGRMAARAVGASLSRTGVAVAALAAALSVSVGVGVMVRSFRAAVEEWLADTLRADVYISAPPLVAAHNQGSLPRALATRLRQVPGVRAVSTARNLTLPTGTGLLFLSALDLDPAGHPRLRMLDGDEAAALRRFENDDAVLVSEPLAYKRGLRRGDALTLTTRTGPRRFAVAGVYRDYGSDAGAALIARRSYDRHFDDPFVSSIAIYAAPGTEEGALLDAVRAALAAAAPELDLLVRPSAVLRRATLQVFDHTFEITSVLRMLALLVAVGGIAGSLMALELERVRELGVLRALGFTPGQVSALIAIETALLGLTAGLFAVPLGAALAALLVFVINRRSFGWTMALRLAPDVLLAAPALGLMAGLLGGLVPALLMARISPAEALREE